MSVCIDLGTNACRVGVWENGTLTQIPNDWDELATASYVRVEENGYVIGSVAKAGANLNFGNTVFGAKHLLGAEYRKPCTQKLVQRWPFHVQEGPQGEAVIRIGPRTESPDRLLAIILAQLRTDVWRNGVEVLNAVSLYQDVVSDSLFTPLPRRWSLP